MTTNYELAWKQRRHLRRLALLVPIVGLLAIFGVSRLQGFGWAFSPLMVAWFATSVALGFRAARWHCPRCGRVFQTARSSNPFTRRCLHCGLPVGASGSDAGAT